MRRCAGMLVLNGGHKGNRLKSMTSLTTLAGLLLAGCAYAPVPAPSGSVPPESLGDCCARVEVYPAILIDAVEPKADRKQALGTPHRFRPPHLEQFSKIVPHIRQNLRPLDLLTTSDKGLLTGYLIPGYFGHSLVYLGTPEQLKAEGLWTLPALRPHHARLQVGEVFFESVPDQVGFASEADVFNVDAVGVFRPRMTLSQKREAMTRLISQLGKPFDRRMDSRTSDCLYCAELLDTSFPWLRFPKVTAYGRPVLSPDRIARHALESDDLRFVGFYYGQGNKAVAANADTLAATLLKHTPKR